MSKRVVRIGSASAALSDSALAVPQMLERGQLDYLVGDYLAEGSMGLLANIASAQARAGFAPDFIPVHIAPHLQEIARQGVKLVVNAGGVNPRGCAAALREVAAQQGLRLSIAVVDGDDLMPRVDAFRAAGVRDMFTGVALPDAPIDSMNAYLGAFPIADALAAGADIVITGRVVDSALTLGPLIHEFGWRPEDYDELAAGTLAGHLLECGAQVTGGTFTDWRSVPGWADIGYPIAECSADGSFVVTKPEGTGGLVSRGTVAEQLLYETSDPQCYFVPDVTCDFSGVHLEEVGPDRVRVTGARGLPRTSTYKVCTIFRKGWRVAVVQPITGLEAAAKGERQAAALIERTGRMLREQGMQDWSRTHVELLGTECTQGARARNRNTREVLCRIVLEHEDKRACDMFMREQYSGIVSMSPGTSINVGMVVTPLQALFSFLLDKREITPVVTVDGVSRISAVATDGSFDKAQIVRPQGIEAREAGDDAVEVPLIGLAWARSGDKGNLFNVGVIARHPDFLPYILSALTPEAVAAWFAHEFDDLGAQRVERFLLPGFDAVNFVIHDALGGGITCSPRLDAVAKGKAQQLLCFPVRIPATLAQRVSPSLLDFDRAEPYTGAL